MDKSEFVGWNVRVTTKNNSVIEGYVSEVNEADSRLILIDTEVFIGNKSRQVELVSVQGEDIVDLQVISNAAAASKQHMPAKSRDMKPESPVMRDPAILRTSSDKLTHASSPPPPPPPSHPVDAKKTPVPWALDDAKDLKKVEFDFQTNLQLFDKKKTFEVMRGTLRHEDLLVTNNLASKPAAAINKSPSVPLMPAAQFTPTTHPSSGKSITKEKLFEESKPRKMSFAEDQPASMPQPPVRILQKPAVARKEADAVEERREELSRPRLGREEFVSVVGSIHNIRVPLASEESIALIEQKTSKLTGPTTDQQIESAAREIVRVLLNEELTGMPSAAAVLAGNHRDGAVAIAVGRTLANRGVSVVAYFSSPTLMDHVAFQRKLFMSAGGKCVDLVDGSPSSPLTSPDVVIDGVLGREGVKDAEFKRLVGSLDLSCIASIERPLTKSHCVFTTILPKRFHGQVDRDHHRLYLVDTNIPVATLKTVFADYNPSTLFGTKMSVRLR